MSTLTTSPERLDFDVFNKEVHALRKIPDDKAEEAKRLVRGVMPVAPSTPAAVVANEHLDRRRYALRLAEHALVKYVQAPSEPVENQPVELEIDIDSQFYPEQELTSKKLIKILQRYHVFDGKRNIVQVNLRYIDDQYGPLLLHHREFIGSALLECGVKLEIAQRAKAKAQPSANRLFNGQFGQFEKDELGSLFNDWNDGAKG